MIEPIERSKLAELAQLCAGAAAAEEPDAYIADKIFHAGSRIGAHHLDTLHNLSRRMETMLRFRMQQWRGR